MPSLRKQTCERAEASRRQQHQGNLSKVGRRAQISNPAITWEAWGHHHCTGSMDGPTPPIGLGNMVQLHNSSLQKTNMCATGRSFLFFVFFQRRSHASANMCATGRSCFCLSSTAVPRCRKCNERFCKSVPGDNAQIAVTRSQNGYHAGHLIRLNAQLVDASFDKLSRVTDGPRSSVTMVQRNR